jgi:hypothetical protein
MSMHLQYNPFDEIYCKTLRGRNPGRLTTATDHAMKRSGCAQGERRPVTGFGGDTGTWPAS